MRGKPPWPTSSRLDMFKRDLDSLMSFTPTHRRRRPTHMRGKLPWPACIHAEPRPEPSSVAPLHHPSTHRHRRPTHMRGKPLSSRLSSHFDELKCDLNMPACPRAHAYA
ncbi:hypothetical protein PIB30_088703 [Stylosanthes scabra]|uniref:Uncharacterized protein n=1 Tax=Stylosanthes scabra TaxID=79078 RepID=A0ABU6TUG3_9FABA|nr:hypothetical protein [Stylosanthes scabra]